MSVLVPEYLDIDFNSLVTKIKEELANSTNSAFRDMNYEGSNISLLIELIAYIGELNLYYLNKLARNVYLETADIYENVNRLARTIGYEPKGYRSGRVILTVTISDCPTGGIEIPAWKEVDTGEQTTDGDAIVYTTTLKYTDAAPTSASTFSLHVRQGELVELEYTGSDLIDNELILPSNYAYDDDIDDVYPSVEVSVKTDGVNYDIWQRVSDFYDDATVLLDNDELYTFIYDKYERNKIVFNSSRDVPESDMEIRIRALTSFGSNGSVSANITGWTPETEFVYDSTLGTYLDNSTITITNSGASVGAAEPEVIDIIKNNAKTALHSQFRNVTSSDYISHLEARSDVIAAAAWGEQDIAPSGSVPEYNKVYVSAIPSTWGSSTISTSASTFVTDWSTSESIDVPTTFSSTWGDTLKSYLEPRKMMSAYETFQAPELIYFSFDLGVRIKRLYTFTDVSTDIKNKLIYYFRNANMDFDSTINFMDILNYVINITEISPTNEFTNVRGIENFIIREINLSANIYEYNTDGNYPYYTVSSYTGDNILRPIKLGYNQFPMLSSDTLRFTEEV
jgi:hypothetical protein